MTFAGMKKYLIISFIFYAPFFACAQENWDLKTCIAYGLKNHLSKRIYSNEQLAAQAKAKEALSAYLPSLSVTGSVDNNLKVQESIIPAGVFGPTDTKIAFSKKFSTNAAIQLDQTIYDQSLITGLKANKFAKQQAELNIVANDETIVYNISTAYYQIFVYREQLNLLRSNQLNYNRQLEISRLQVEKGVATPVDLNKIQVDYNNNDSEIALAESNLVTSINQLKNAMGVSLSADIQIDSIAAQLPLNMQKLPADTAFNPVNRVEYRLAAVDYSMLEIDEKRINAGIFPTLSFYGRYGGNGFGDKLNESISNITDFSAVGLKLSWNLFDGFKRGAQSGQARYLRLNASENLNLSRANYHLEYANATTKVRKAQSSMINDEQNVTLAQSVFKSTDLQYRKGVTGLTEWLNAQDALKDAQNNYLNSLYNFYLARIDLEKANGTLLNFYSSL